jgi:anti-sigma factor RsiW
MTCGEASRLLPLFFDGELDARQMRAVALHDTRCPECEPELRRMERLQELISDTINARVDETDFSNFWPAIEAQLGTVQLSWWERARAWWSENEHPWVVRVPVFAMASAIAVLALLFFVRAYQPTAKPDAPQLAAVDNSAAIDSLDTDVDTVTMLNDPETRTTVIWVSEDTPVSGDVP